MREAEAKLSAPPRFRMPRSWGLEGLDVVPGKRMRLTAQYYDTPDFRLARWGASLRHRTGEGWTVKLPEGSSDGVLLRAEHRFKGRPGSPPDDALDLVRAYVRHSPLEPIARLRTLRTSFSVRDEDGREVAELVDDRVSVEGGPTPGRRFREIEIELRDGAPKGLIETISSRLGALESQMRSKVVQALGPPAEGPPDVVQPALDDTATAADVVRAAIASSVLRLLEADPGARLGRDPEFVHRCRVASRRLRSDLRTFAPLLDPTWTAGLRDELRWIANSLGKVRDSDVLLEGFRRRAAKLPDRMKRPSLTLLRRLEKEGQEHRQAMLQDLRSERYERLLDRLVEAARSPLLGEGALEPASETVPQLAAAPWHHLRTAAEALDKTASEEELHRLRIRTKRARYAAEAVQGIGGASVARFAKAAARLQDVLGIHQDAVVASEWLRGKVARASGPVAFAGGALAASCWEEGTKARERWMGEWKRLAKRVPEGWE